MDVAVDRYVEIETKFGFKGEEYRSLDTDEKKFEYAYKHFNVFCFDKFKSTVEKNFQIGEVLKIRGNDAFKHGNYKVALKHYSTSITIFPQRSKGEKEAFSIVLANRSAALYHMGEYKLALVDIDLAIDYGYPVNLTYKVLERKAKCLLALKKLKGAQQVFRKMIQSLSEAELPNKKRKELQQQTQEELTKLNKIRNISDEDENPEAVPLVAGGKHSKYKAISSAVEIVYTNKTTYAVASRNIEPGEILGIEEAHCAFVTPELSKILCFHCLKRATAPQPCPDCCQVVFCSVNCQKIALLTHHKYECCILGKLWQSRMHRWFLALRMLTQRGLQHFIDMRQTLQEPAMTVHSRIYSSDDYKTVYNLRTDNDPPMRLQDLLEIAIHSVSYLKLLRDAKFFTPSEVVSSDLTDEEKYIGGLILHNMLVATHNESMVTYMVKHSGRVLVGTGIFPTNLCFEHSCVPSVFGYYNGTTLISRAVHSIKKGDKITVNFKKSYFGRDYIYNMAVPIEMEFLKRDHCNCEPCKRHWPHMQELAFSLQMVVADNSFESTWIHCNCGNVVSCLNFMWCSKCNKALGMETSVVLPVEIMQLCENSKQLLKHMNVSEALTVSQKAASLLNRAPLPLLVYYCCLKTVTMCLEYCGNMITEDNEHFVPARYINFV